MRRKKDFRTGIEKLNELMSVCEDKSIMEVEASEVIDALASVRAEIFLYVQHWANKEGKGCKAHLAFPSIDFDFPAEDGGFSGSELIYLPFMSCSVWFWEKMLQEPENPIFETVRYCCMCVHYLRCKLVMYGVPYDKPITSELLSEYNILDVFEIYKYEHIFRDALQHIEGR